MGAIKEKTSGVGRVLNGVVKGVGRGCRLAVDNTVRYRTRLSLPAIIILRCDCKSYTFFAFVVARICRLLQWE